MNEDYSRIMNLIFEHVDNAKELAKYRTLEEEGFKFPLSPHLPNPEECELLRKNESTLIAFRKAIHEICERNKNDQK